MFWMLHDCGVPVKHLVEPFAGHGDYVTTWRGRPSHKSGSKVGLLGGAILPLCVHSHCKESAADMLRPALLRRPLIRELICQPSLGICC